MIGGALPRSRATSRLVSSPSRPAPIDTLAPDVARGIEVVAFDVDDTLTTHGVLSREAYDALWSLRDAGLALVAATGRPYGWADVWARLWPIDCAVAENGACWVWREGGGVRKGYAAPAENRTAQQATLVRISEDVLASVPSAKLAQDQPMRATDLAFDIGETQRLPRADVEAIEAVMHAHGARTLVSSVHVHAFFGEHHKGTGILAAYEDRHGRRLDPSRVLFLGDSPNDAGAFATFDASVGVANVASALSRLPVAPRWITSREAGLGFAEATTLLLARRRVR